MTADTLIERLKDEDVPIETIFDELLTYFSSQTDKELAQLLERFRHELDAEADYARLLQIGDLGGASDDYKKAMVRAFVYADKHKIL